jgi:hypothetical protein
LLEFTQVYLQAVQVDSPFLPVVFVTVLAVVAGLAVFVLGWARVRYLEVVRVAAIWLAVPVALSMAVAVAKPNLLRARYLHPMIVPLSGLAAVGLLVLAELVFRLVKSRGRELVGAVLAGVLVVGSLGVQVGINWDDQVGLYSPQGHGNDFGGALGRIDAELKANPDLPLLAEDRFAAAMLLVVRPDLGARNIGCTLNQRSVSVWPSVRSATAVLGSPAGRTGVIWLVSKAGRPTPPTAPPAVLRGGGFRLVSATSEGDWWVAVLKR